MVSTTRTQGNGSNIHAGIVGRRQVGNRGEFGCCALFSDGGLTSAVHCTLKTKSVNGTLIRKAGSFRFP
jgi:hypothetical protein